MLATALTLMVIAGFVRLGFWQLHSAAEKRSLMAQHALNRQSTVDLTPTNAGTLSRYQRVRLRGRYDSRHQILLDNMPSNSSAHPGQPGYRVLTPFALEQGGWLLIDRGWLASGPTRAVVPAVDVGTTPRELTGLLSHLPRAGVQLDQSAIAAEGSWPRVLNFPQQATLERVLSRPLLPGMVLLDPQAVDGYERVWEIRFSIGPARHIAYAVQWFALAAAALCIYLVLIYRHYRSR
ncbi:hypothetical protein ACG33_15345 [Steroidobacter denitrificans]|uniref:SURF1-like protein n=1 Tax=Steroidobacter denitrificans TaxID=465721 RepID=A0A127FF09_STEDE|nr:hypothetical protein ACG33_15345 [Steroidobacter denitrificans]